MGRKCAKCKKDFFPGDTHDCPVTGKTEGGFKNKNTSIDPATGNCLICKKNPCVCQDASGTQKTVGKAYQG